MNVYQLNDISPSDHYFKQQNKHIYVLLVLSMIIICAMTSSAITATKPVHLILQFPFSNIMFGLFTFPVIDAVCELYGKKQAYFVAVLGVISQMVFVFIIELSVITPSAQGWVNQSIYAEVLAKSSLVILGTFIGFLISQFFDIFIFQMLKEFSKGKQLWFRSAFSSIIGQFVDSVIFISIVFWSFPDKTSLIIGAFVSKSILSIVAIPITYAIVFGAKRYLRTPVGQY
ncbi:queuosine precursor transporter [Facilibium subflavum]|uniref:queuosine precursor transporter n=1 Tax=Facilibium subflavum TaxID=2219058 RepID=UPI000E6557FC|nr:queuosine precursor transporter [Facilibium subflavum]